VLVQAYLNYKQNKIGTFYAFPFADTCRATSPVHESRYCAGEDAKDNANEDFTIEGGWYFPPNNCSEIFN
jgi:hypothetical protein